VHVSFWQKTGCETTKFLIPSGQICRWRKLREIHVSFWPKPGCEVTQISSFWQITRWRKPERISWNNGWKTVKRPNDVFLSDKLPDGESRREFHGTMAGKL